MSDDSDDELETVEIPSISIDGLLAKSIDNAAESISNRPGRDAELVEISDYEEKIERSCSSTSRVDTRPYKGKSGSSVVVGETEAFGVIACRRRARSAQTPKRAMLRGRTRTPPCELFTSVPSVALWPVLGWKRSRLVTPSPFVGDSDVGQMSLLNDRRGLREEGPESH